MIKDESIKERIKELEEEATKAVGIGALHRINLELDHLRVRDNPHFMYESYFTTRQER